MSTYIYTDKSGSTAGNSSYHSMIQRVYKNELKQGPITLTFWDSNISLPKIVKDYDSLPRMYSEGGTTPQVVIRQIADKSLHTNPHNRIIILTDGHIPVSDVKKCRELLADMKDFNASLLIIAESDDEIDTSVLSSFACIKTATLQFKDTILDLSKTLEEYSDMISSDPNNVMSFSAYVSTLDYSARQDLRKQLNDLLTSYSTIPKDCNFEVLDRYLMLNLKQAASPVPQWYNLMLSTIDQTGVIALKPKDIKVTATPTTNPARQISYECKIYDLITMEEVSAADGLFYCIPCFTMTGDEITKVTKNGMFAAKLLDMSTYEIASSVSLSKSNAVAPVSRSTEFGEIMVGSADQEKLKNYNNFQIARIFFDARSSRSVSVTADLDLLLIAIWYSLRSSNSADQNKFAEALLPQLRHRLSATVMLTPNVRVKVPKYVQLWYGALNRFSVTADIVMSLMEDLNIKAEWTVNTPVELYADANYLKTQIRTINDIHKLQALYFPSIHLDDLYLALDMHPSLTVTPPADLHWYIKSKKSEMYWMQVLDVMMNFSTTKIYPEKALKPSGFRYIDNEWFQPPPLTRDWKVVDKSQIYKRWGNNPFVSCGKYLQESKAIDFDSYLRYVIKQFHNNPKCWQIDEDLKIQRFAYPAKRAPYSIMNSCVQTFYA